mmetsp:Transcript_14018/g.48275  ORF Transcript_14018/g.48275 Transcript_14018/m.48275 type:complete len:233 (+) Transcript_14018:160-858(+)
MASGGAAVEGPRLRRAAAPKDDGPDGAARAAQAQGAGVVSGEPGVSGAVSGEDAEAGAYFECNICLELAREPVVTLCGHLYCWPCLYRWMHLRRECKHCPVCKAAVTEDKLIPLYGRGMLEGRPLRKASGEEPADGGAGGAVPSRPIGHRPAEVPGPGGIGFTGSTFPVTGGMSMLPQLLGLQFGQDAAVEHRPRVGAYLGETMSPEQQQQAFLSRLLLMLGSCVIMCLLLF